MMLNKKTIKNMLLEIEDLNFETLDVITRCNFLSSVLSDVLDNILD